MEDARSSCKVCPRKFFNVADDVKFLESSQLEEFEQAFRTWKDAPKDAVGQRSRTRIWLVFMLLRHSGARLGEVLSLDDTECFDAGRKVVRLGTDGRVREVPLSDEVFSEITRVLNSPMGYSLQGEFFKLDQGYFRRICYARGKECGLSSKWASPKILRNTRAVEMLRAGVPITVVKEILGQSSLNLTASFQQFSQEDMYSIMHCAQKVTDSRTSILNEFEGYVVNIKSGDGMAEVVLETPSADMIVALITSGSLRNLDLADGSPVTAAVKAYLVDIIRCGDSFVSSTRNSLKGTIIDVDNSTVLSDITGLLADGTEIHALISSHSSAELALQVGDEVEFRFKALSVILKTMSSDF